MSAMVFITEFMMPMERALMLMMPITKRASSRDLVIASDGGSYLDRTSGPCCVSLAGDGAVVLGQ